MDLWQMVSADHANIRELCREVLRATGGGPNSRANLFEDLDDEVERHIGAMESVLYPALSHHLQTSQHLAELTQQHEEIRDRLHGLAAYPNKNSRTWALDFKELESALTHSRVELDQLTQKVIAAGIASWSGGDNDDRQLIVRGHANLLEDLHALEDLERVKSLFDDLETKRGVIDLLGRAERAEGVRIFIGSENKLFSLSGSSTIIAPYSDGAGRIVGVLGVIGPTRLNYARVIPTVDYAARIVSRMLGG